MRLLLAEDDEALVHRLQPELQQAGYAVDHTRDGRDALFLGRTETYDAVVLDLGLPELAGLDVLRRWRNDGFGVPVLILTARDTWREKVEGLKAGADDYLTKPFEIAELFARVRALLRRKGDHKATRLQGAGISLDPVDRQVWFEDETQTLTAREFAILEILLRNAGRFVSRARLEEGIYSWGEEVGSNTVEVYISRLRKRFGSEAIETMRGIGYRIPR